MLGLPSIANASFDENGEPIVVCSTQQPCDENGEPIVPNPCDTQTCDPVVPRPPTSCSFQPCDENGEPVINPCENQVCDENGEPIVDEASASSVKIKPITKGIRTSYHLRWSGKNNWIASR